MKLINWSALTRDGEEHRFRNFYRHCGGEWDDTWSCKCNDECPKCGAEIEPYRSEDL